MAFRRDGGFMHEGGRHSDAVAVRLRWVPRWTLTVPAVLLAATALAYLGTSVG
jgi:hypothetical protein